MKIAFLFKEGKTVKNSFFVLKFITSKEGEDGRVFIVVPTKIAKTSVQRHRIKRKFTALIRKVISDRVHCFCMFIVQSPALSASDEELNNSVRSIWQKTQ